MLAAAAARWIAACRSCSSLSPDPVAAARSWLMAARRWASPALRNARVLAAIARSAAACEAATWRCAAASRSLGSLPGAPPWCSSSIRARIALIRCLISSRRLPSDSGSFPTRLACPLHSPSRTGTRPRRACSLGRIRRGRARAPGIRCSCRPPERRHRASRRPTRRPYGASCARNRSRHYAPSRPTASGLPAISRCGSRWPRPSIYLAGTANCILPPVGSGRPAVVKRLSSPVTSWQRRRPLLLHARSHPVTLERIRGLRGPATGSGGARTEG
jgi:hypothetical protein